MEQAINQGQLVSQSPVSSQQPISQPTKNSFPKLIVILLIILACTTSFLVGKSLSQPKIISPPETNISPSKTIPTIIDSTNNWKTYRDNDLGFEFKYPNDWNLDEVNKPRMYQITSPDYELDPSSQSYCPSLNNGLSFDVGIHNDTSTSLSGEKIFYFLKDQEQKRINFKGKEALRFELFNFNPALCKAKNSNHRIGIIFKHSVNRMVSFQLMSNEKYDKEFIKKLFDQILSTFKFLP